MIKWDKKKKKKILNCNLNLFSWATGRISLGIETEFESPTEGKQAIGVRVIDGLLYFHDDHRRVLNKADETQARLTFQRLTSWKIWGNSLCFTIWKNTNNDTNHAMGKFSWRQTDAVFRIFLKN